MDKSTIPALVFSKIDEVLFEFSETLVKVNDLANFERWARRIFKQYTKSPLELLPKLEIVGRVFVPIAFSFVRFVIQFGGSKQSQS